MHKVHEILSQQKLHNNTWDWHSQPFRMLNWHLDIKVMDKSTEKTCHMSTAFKAWNKLTIYCFRSTS